jgi:anti-sigma factor RsiW
MAMTNEQLTEMSEIETLLPWYVKGTLGPEDTARVEAHLATHPETQRALALIAEEWHETVAANEGLGAPTPAARDRLMAALAAEEAAGAPAPRAGTLLWQHMKATWAALVPEGVSPVAAFGGMAAAIVIVVQSVALAVLIAGGSPSGGGMRLASGPEAGVLAGADFYVRFAKNATAGDIMAHLKPLNATIIDGPKPGGFFKLRVTPAPRNSAGSRAVLKKLRARRDIVVFATEAK